ncbi:MAG: biotin transporter BioY [Deltaproteobacteria bacterium]|nr:biotin transporter BioY [Deltaproteobacteria bacterium]
MRAEEPTKNPLRMMVYASLLAALTAASALFSIQIGDVPVILYNFFILLMGLLLGSRWGTASVAVYLLTGSLGLPVFAGGKGGLAILLGPTGGYLIGFLPAVFIIGLISEKFNRRLWPDIIALLCGTAVIYALGVIQLKIVLDKTWMVSLAIGFFPFIIFDLIKLVAAAVTARAIRPIIKSSSRVGILEDI